MSILVLKSNNRGLLTSIGNDQYDFPLVKCRAETCVWLDRPPRPCCPPPTSVSIQQPNPKPLKSYWTPRRSLDLDSSSSLRPLLPDTTRKGVNPSLKVLVLLGATLSSQELGPFPNSQEWTVWSFISAFSHTRAYLLEEFVLRLSFTAINLVARLSRRWCTDPTVSTARVPSFRSNNNHKLWHSHVDSWLRSIARWPFWPENPSPRCPKSFFLHVCVKQRQRCWFQRWEAKNSTPPSDPHFDW